MLKNYFDSTDKQNGQAIASRIRIARRLFKKAVQQGRSERKGLSPFRPATVPV